jgi:hypothetical protein
MIPPLVEVREESSGFFLGRFENATGWCKELKALPILNFSLTSSRLFHKVFNKAVEKCFLFRS